jgi:hypothetical protein
LQLSAAVAQRPLSQLPEQQSVPLVHVPRKGLQVAQSTPTRQEAPLQQPLVQLEASQTHWLFTQCCPLLHAAPVPHLHVPPEQVSASAESQATHAVPPPPHCDVDGEVTQPLLVQHPF